MYRLRDEFSRDNTRFLWYYFQGHVCLDILMRVDGLDFRFSKTNKLNIIFKC